MNPGECSHTAIRTDDHHKGTCAMCQAEVEYAPQLRQWIMVVVPKSTRPAMTPEVSTIAQRLTTNPSTMSNTNDAHIILDKELRRDIDAIIQRLKEGTGDANSTPIPTENQRKSRERSLTITKLQEAVMWLGMDLKAINDANPGAVENPYPHSKDPTNTVIDKTADGLKL